MRAATEGTDSATPDAELPLADRETASLGDPFSQELLSVKERNITGDNVAFSSLEQNIPGFSLMFVLLTLIFSVSLSLREEEVWNTSTRLSILPITAMPSPSKTIPWPSAPFVGRPSRRQATQQLRVIVRESHSPRKSSYLSGAAAQR